MNLSRRKLFTGIGVSLLAAPAIVRVSSLMALPRPQSCRVHWIGVFWPYEYTEIALGYSLTTKQILDDLNIKTHPIPPLGNQQKPDPYPLPYSQMGPFDE